MKHIPFFRWFVTLGLVLVGCSVGVYLATPDYPEREQVDLTVLNEAPDGTCTVRWTDPFERVEHTGPYQCDRYRPATFKAPDYEPGTDLGWDVGYVFAEGSQQGELYSLADDEDIEASIALSDQLLGDRPSSHDLRARGRQHPLAGPCDRRAPDGRPRGGTAA
ncbi:hypothetical protein [Streptomyces parvulus]|uniref:hypothetical protein n=1 Tax=Streptomyces parvulus TaxID=146923 RepID=UPI00210B0618|nr:hypothetical protein [Streptomyces parvulus]MCQ4196335.1 hypothetical protein [Streptomyces parvulus]